MDIIAETFRRFGLTPRRTGGEYHCGCPFCMEGEDRFIIWPEGNYLCRFCGRKGFLDDDLKTWRPDPDKLKRAADLAAQQERQTAERLVAWQNNGAKDHVFEYNQALRPEHRQWWRSQGIEDEAQQYYLFGFCEHKRVKSGEDYADLPAFTIPVLSPFTGHLVNIQYRLMNPPEGIGKYRQETGLPAAIFYASPITEGDVIILEGAKKAVVLSEFVGRSVQVAGLPGISPRRELLEELKWFGRKWLLPDPGVSEAQIERIADVLPGLCVARLPLKPDDAVLRGMSLQMFRRYISQARRMS